MPRTGFAYVGCFTSAKRQGHGTGIVVFELMQNGEWRSVHTAPAADNPSFLLADNEGRHLYAAHGDGRLVSSFRIDQTTGQLSELGRRDTGGSNVVHLSLSPDQRHLVVANFASGSVAVFARNPDGTLSPRTQILPLSGEPGPIADEQRGSQPHEVRFDPTGRHILVPDRGTDRLHRLGFDPATAHLTIAGPAQLSTPGAGPRHLVYHPSLPIVYVVDELSSHLTIYEYSSITTECSVLQSLSTLPADYTGESAAAEIALSRNARFVYISNRGHDSVAGFAITRTGTVLPPSFTKTGGEHPRFMRFGPDSDTLFVANQKTDTIVAFDADPGTGALTQNGLVIATGSPSCIEFVVR